MITYEPTLVPGMLEGESAYIVRVANDDGTEREIFNIGVRLATIESSCATILVRRVDSFGQGTATSLASAPDEHHAILAAAEALQERPQEECAQPKLDCTMTK